MLGVVLYRGMAGQFSAEAPRRGRGDVAVLALRRRRLDPAVLAALPAAGQRHTPLGGPRRASAAPSAERDLRRDHLRGHRRPLLGDPDDRRLARRLRRHRRCCSRWASRWASWSTSSSPARTSDELDRRDACLSRPPDARRPLERHPRAHRDARHPGLGRDHRAPAGRDHGPGRRLARSGSSGGSGASRPRGAASQGSCRRTPAGIHMPGPSWSPVFAAIGDRCCSSGLVFGGLILWLGVLALVLTLLYWLAEALRIYDHDVGTTMPAAAGRGPHRPAAGRPHARAVVPTVPRRDRRDDAHGRPGLRRLAAAGRGRRPHPDARRLAGRCAEGVPQTRSRPTRPGTSSIPPRGRRRSCCASSRSCFVGGVLLQTGLLPPGRRAAERRGAIRRRLPPSGSAAPSGPPASGGPPPAARDRRRQDHGPGHRVPRADRRRARPTRRSRSPSSTRPGHAAQRRVQGRQRRRTRCAASRSPASRRRSTRSRRCRPARTPSSARSTRT